MIRDVKVERLNISSLHGALDWSEDGLFAITNSENVVVIKPFKPTNDRTGSAPTSSSAFKIDEKYEYMAADVLDVIKPIGEPPITKFSIETYGSDDFALSVSWSPSGTSPSRGCLLSVLTNQGDVILYDYTTKSTPANWTRVVSCVKSLQGALNDDPEHVIPPDEIRDYVFNSTSWSPRFPSKSPELNKWGFTFLACGTKSGKIVIFKPEHVRDDEAQSKTQLDLVQVFDLTCGLDESDEWIQHLKWSPWIKGADGKYYTLLIAAISSNRILAKPLVFDPLKEEFDYTFPVSTVQKPSRFFITTIWLHFHKETSNFVLAVAQPSGISIHVFNVTQDDILATKTHEQSALTTSVPPQLFKIQRLFWKTPSTSQPISTVCLFDKTPGQLWVIGLADRINTFMGTVTIPKDSSECTFELAFPGSDTGPFDLFVERRVNAMNDSHNKTGTIGESAATYQFCFHGVVPYPVGGGYFAFLNRLITENQLRYILTSSTRFQISFQPACLDESGDTRKRLGPPSPAAVVKSLPAAIQGSSESIWWKVKALSNSVRSVKSRPLYIKKVIEELETYAAEAHADSLYTSRAFDETDDPMGDGAPEYTAICADVTKTFFLTKFYDVLRLIIHLKGLALQMQQSQTQIREKELASIAGNSFTNTAANQENGDSSVNGSAADEPYLFGEDISRYASDIEKHTLVILRELCFLVLSHVATPGAPKPASGIERAIIQSYILQLESDRNQQEDASGGGRNHRFNKEFVSRLLARCKSLVAMEKKETAGPEYISVTGDGFSEEFDFQSQEQRDEMASKRGYQWKRCTVSLLPLTYFGTKVCGGCSRQTAVLSCYDSENNPEFKDSHLLRAILGSDTFDICVYCGCRYTQT